MVIEQASRYSVVVRTSHFPRCEWSFGSPSCDTPALEELVSERAQSIAKREVGTSDLYSTSYRVLSVVSRENRSEIEGLVGAMAMNGVHEIARKYVVGGM